MNPPDETNLSVQPASVGDRESTASDTPDVDVTDRSPQDRRKRTRAWSQITGITLHQTGVHHFPAKAWPRVTCHLGVHSDGSVYHVHPLQALLWASNGFNSSTIAIEVAGNYRREEGRPNSFWSTGGGPSTLTPVIIAGIRKAIRFAIAEVRRSGGRIDLVHAHRQASKGRPACPGEAIWRAGGVWAQTELGLSDGGDGYTIGDGLPIPTAWDGRRGHVAHRGFDPAALESADSAEHSAEVDVEFPDADDVTDR